MLPQVLLAYLVPALTPIRLLTHALTHPRPHQCIAAVSSDLVGYRQRHTQEWHQVTNKVLSLLFVGWMVNSVQ